MKRWLSLIIAVITLGVLIGWRLQQKKAAVAAQNEQRQARMKTAPVVSVAPVQVRDIVRTFEGVGSVEAPLNVKLAPKVTGRIAFLQVREGDTVRAGQVLVRIDPPELEAQLRQRRAAITQAEHKLAQARLAREPAHASVNTQIRQQEAALTSARANQEQVNQSLASQVAGAEASIADMEGRVANAEAAMANAEAAMANAEASIASATANLENARAYFERVDGLYKQGFIAAQDVDNARTAVKVQEAAVTTARGQLNAAKAQRASAVAQRASAAAQKSVAQRQAEVVKNKGKADMALAKAQVAQVQAGLDYAEVNSAQKPAYDENVGALEADVAAARAALANTEALLADTVLKSPIDGVVNARFLDPGSLATPTQPVLAVQALRQMWVTVPVPADVSRGLRLGQTGSIALDGVPGKALTGRIIQMNPAADPSSRQFSVRFLLDNPGGRIKPGMFARVSIEVERVRGAVVVPREAVKQTEEGATVAVVGPDSKVQIRPVALGASDPRGIAITNGLTAGEQVVTLSAMSVKDGQEVRIAGAGGSGGRGGRGGEGGRGPGAGARGGEGQGGKERGDEGREGERAGAGEGAGRPAATGGGPAEGHGPGGARIGPADGPGEGARSERR